MGDGSMERDEIAPFNGSVIDHFYSFCASAESVLPFA